MLNSRKFSFEITITESSYPNSGEKLYSKVLTIEPNRLL